jgi:hypothetical protein
MWRTAGGVQQAVTNKRSVNQRTLSVITISVARGGSWSWSADAYDGKPTGHHPGNYNERE